MLIGTLLPYLAVSCLRPYSDADTAHLCPPAEQPTAYNTASWRDIGVLSMSTYIIWVVLCYIKVTMAMLSSLQFQLITPLIGCTARGGKLSFPIL